jgi:hypothetical protein
LSWGLNLEFRNCISAPILGVIDLLSSIDPIFRGGINDVSTVIEHPIQFVVYLAFCLEAVNYTFAPGRAQSRVRHSSHVLSQISQELGALMCALLDMVVGLTSHLDPFTILPLVVFIMKLIDVLLVLLGSRLRRRSFPIMVLTCLVN